MTKAGEGNIFMTQNSLDYDSADGAKGQKIESSKSRKKLKMYPNVSSSMMNLLNMTKNYCNKFSHREYKPRRRAFEINMQTLLK